MGTDNLADLLIAKNLQDAKVQRLYSQLEELRYQEAKIRSKLKTEELEFIRLHNKWVIASGGSTKDLLPESLA
jgi:hypothetical protein